MGAGRHVAYSENAKRFLAGDYQPLPFQGKELLAVRQSLPQLGGRLGGGSSYDFLRFECLTRYFICDKVKALSENAFTYTRMSHAFAESAPRHYLRRCPPGWRVDLNGQPRDE